MHPPQLPLPRPRQLGPNPRQLALIKPRLSPQSQTPALERSSSSRTHNRRPPPLRLFVVQPVAVRAGYRGRGGAC